jgi:hypothetical protein
VQKYTDNTGVNGSIGPKMTGWMESNNPAVLSILMNSGFTTNVQGMEKIMETIYNIEIKLFVLVALKKTLFFSIFRYSFVCLRCEVPMSVHYRLCSVTVRKKVLQNGRFVRFSKKTDRLLVRVQLEHL